MSDEWTTQHFTEAATMDDGCVLKSFSSTLRARLRIRAMV